MVAALERHPKPRKAKSYAHPDRKWEVHDAMHTMLRAHEIGQNKSLMKQVRKHAASHAHDMKMQSHRAMTLAKAGKISAKAMAKLTKNHPLA